MPLGSVEGALDVLANIGGAIIGAPAQLAIDALASLRNTDATVADPQAAGEEVAAGATSGGAAGPRASGGTSPDGGTAPADYPAGEGASLWPWLLGLGVASIVGYMVYATTKGPKRRSR